jgi:hypothetical protein
MSPGWPWKNVKRDGLPEKDGRYLVVEDHHGLWIGVSSMRKGEFDMEITHWMPLPEPPIG